MCRWLNKCWDTGPETLVSVTLHGHTRHFIRADLPWLSCQWPWPWNLWASLNFFLQVSQQYMKVLLPEGPALNGCWGGLRWCGRWLLNPDGPATGWWLILPLLAVLTVSISITDGSEGAISMMESSAGLEGLSLFLTWLLMVPGCLNFGSVLSWDLAPVSELVREDILTLWAPDLRCPGKSLAWKLCLQGRHLFKIEHNFLPNYFLFT